MRKLSLLLGIVAIASTAASSPVVAGEKVDINSLPLPVMKAVETQFPNAQLLSAERERDDGREKYEVKLRFGEHRYEVDISAQGVLLEADRED